MNSWGSLRFNFKALNLVPNLCNLRKTCKQKFFFLIYWLIFRECYNVLLLSCHAIYSALIYIFRPIAGQHLGRNTKPWNWFFYCSVFCYFQIYTLFIIVFRWYINLCVVFFFFSLLFFVFCNNERNRFFCCDSSSKNKGMLFLCIICLHFSVFTTVTKVQTTFSNYPIFLNLKSSYCTVTKFS